MSQNKIEKRDEINGRSHEEKLEAFLETANDSYAILQLRHTDETISERFMFDLHYREWEKSRNLTTMK